MGTPICWLASSAADGITVPTPAHGVYHGPFGINQSLYLPNGPWCYGLHMIGPLRSTMLRGAKMGYLSWPLWS